jgi:predicted SprT family Zn-dependent metalloprotease
MAMRLISAHNSSNDKEVVGFKSTEWHDYLTCAYDFFAEHLFEQVFNQKLPDAIITLGHKSTARGYYWPEIFKDVAESRQLPEISICWNSLRNDTKTILSTLCHEMAHHYQYAYGKPGKGAYHNREFAMIMLSIGLKAYSILDHTKMTGNKVSHVVLENAKFDVVANEFIKEYGDFALAQGEIPFMMKQEVKRRPVFSCNCGNEMTIPKNLIDVVEIKCKVCGEILKSI